MLSPRSPSVPRLRIACLGPSSRSRFCSKAATVGRFAVQNRQNVTTTSSFRPLASGTRPGLPRRRLAPASLAHVCGKKTRTVVNLDELPQGIVLAKLSSSSPSSLPLEPEPEEHDDGPAYPTVVMQARRNMQKFDNCVLLTRVGGFYELYLDQAEEYGPLLNLKVAQKRTNAGPVPMAGFPFFQLDRFLKILVQDLCRHVAIAEEFPADVSQRAKSGGLMHTRKVARIVTPGTLIDENFMDSYANNYVLAIHLPETGLSKPSEPLRSSDTALLSNTARPPEPSGEEEGIPQEAQQHELTSTNHHVDPPVGLAWLDLSTGRFFTQPTTLSWLGSVLSRVSPREVVLDKALESDENHSILPILAEERYLVSYSQPGELGKLSDWLPMLEAEVPAQTAEKFTDDEVKAGSLLLHYIKDRLQGVSMKLQPPQRFESMQVMNIDKNSMRSLEIKQTIRDGLFRGSLLHTVRRTVTKSGARLLNEWLSSPSTSLDVIHFRQELVARFIQNPDLRDAIIVLLQRSHDSQRLVQKFALNRGDPDDLLRLASTIKATEDIVNLLVESGRQQAQLDDCISVMVSRTSLEQPLKLAQRIRDAIDEEGLVQQHQIEDSEAGEMLALAQEIVKREGSEADSAALLPARVNSKKKKKSSSTSSLPTTTSLRDHYGEDNEVWIMKPGASPALSRLHTELGSLAQARIELTETLRQRLGASTLTLRWTPGLGHICHVKGKDAAQQHSAVASPPPSFRTVSSSRSTRSFHQPEWTHLGERLDKTRLQIRAEEQRVFSTLRAQVVLCLVKLRRNASVLDELDIMTSFARLALDRGLTKPVVIASSISNSSSQPHKTVIIGGRHPTVESGLSEQGRTFQRNDCLVGAPGHGRAWLITGPNMAGKSTFLRQNALITIMAQIGCYVPADYAELSVVDSIFTRVGSADNLYHDQSTFMVEMLETAAILRRATPRSFVIMDEVGRGTTPEDGTAVAFAALHHLLHVNKCRALFATHFHVIADLVAEYKMRLEDGGVAGSVEMYCTDVQEDKKGGFVYVHKLRKGVNTNSHALKVARMAGLPEPAIQIAQRILQGDDISPRDHGKHVPAKLAAVVVG
ncbi:muts domain V-domain-containing protein [Podospora didyma]|uniref:DNA mismatch repair protein n=1 Tax=Podospora didyma TaxID=330526 RepID=A0AAE0P7D5_9PEZI|nr:muts domain V-domain-containing protein [Podospora didyma]